MNTLHYSITILRYLASETMPPTVPLLIILTRFLRLFTVNLAVALLFYYCYCASCCPPKEDCWLDRPDAL